MALLAWLPRKHPRARAPVHERMGNMDGADDPLAGERPAGAILAISAAAPTSDYGYFVFWASTKARPLGPTPLTWMTTASRTSTKCGTLAGSV